MTIDIPRSDAPLVSVIIPATASRDLLYGCLGSISRFAPRDIPFETIVVLNEAGVEDEADLRAMVSGVQIARSPVNLGFTGACNRGRHLARGDLLITLHDDAEIEPGWMEALVDAANEHPVAGAVGSKILFPDGQLQFAGMIMWRDGTTSCPWVGEVPAPSAFDRMRAVDQCGTSSLLVRAAAWDAVGGFDERLYPVYYADVDLCMALRQLGWVVLFQPRSRIRHHKSASTTERFRSFVFPRNRRLFVDKWGSALDEFAPRAAESQEDVERALARADAFAEQCRRRGWEEARAPQDRAPFDPVIQERNCFEKSRALYQAYAEHLTDKLDSAEKDRDRYKVNAEEAAERAQQESDRHKDAAVKAAAAARGEARAATAREQQLRTELTELRRIADTAQAESASLRRKLISVRSDYDAILSSMSWRITAPIRGIGALLGPMWARGRRRRRDRRDYVFLRDSALFDSAWYLKSYQDVGRAGVDPLMHYIRHGAREGRDPGPQFSTRWYRRANPDVDTAGVNPLVHYVQHGASEGRLPLPGIPGADAGEPDVPRDSKANSY